ncbi:hypothetical protein RHSIM_Rhsim02G0172100 [Rhododendron simsii]|uniref:Uncharacterized protein n=1 Tax=Rhododendron simsii TaxID=118357 RepID=A0A834HEU2_RHOSS|nr:hypothetical protein RHSIM_Rhsim02G0172100 [Rhododendron simsii]
MERFQGIEELNGILKKLMSIMETMDVRGKKTNENSLAAKVSMDMKDTPSPVVNEKKGKKELSFDSSISPLTNKEKDRKEQFSGHLTSPLKANQEENTKKPSLSHLTSPLKTNKEQDMKEPKIKPSSKRSRKMATNIGDLISSTAPPTIDMNKRQKKCQQEIPRTGLKGSQPVKKNTNKKFTMESQQEMARTRLKRSQPVKKNINELALMVAADYYAPCLLPLSDQMASCYGDLFCYGTVLDRLFLFDGSHGSNLMYSNGVQVFCIQSTNWFKLWWKDFVVFVHLCKIKEEGISLICSIFMTEIIC